MILFSTLCVLVYRNACINFILYGSRRRIRSIVDQVQLLVVKRSVQFTKINATAKSHDVYKKVMQK